MIRYNSAVPDTSPAKIRCRRILTLSAGGCQSSSSSVPSPSGLSLIVCARRTLHSNAHHTILAGPHLPAYIIGGQTRQTGFLLDIGTVILIYTDQPRGPEEDLFVSNRAYYLKGAHLSPYLFVQINTLTSRPAPFREQRQFISTFLRRVPFKLSLTAATLWPTCFQNLHWAQSKRLHGISLFFFWDPEAIKAQINRIANHN